MNAETGLGLPRERSRKLTAVAPASPKPPPDGRQNPAPLAGGRRASKGVEMSNRDAADSTGEPTPASTPAVLAPTPWQFDRSLHAHVLVKREPATAVYRTRSQRIVIRQANWPEDDQWVELPAADVPALIGALKALCGGKEG